MAVRIFDYSGVECLTLRRIFAFPLLTPRTMAWLKHCSCIEDFVDTIDRTGNNTVRVRDYWDEAGKDGSN